MLSTALVKFRARLPVQYYGLNPHFVLLLVILKNFAAILIACKVFRFKLPVFCIQHACTLLSSH